MPLDIDTPVVVRGAESEPKFGHITCVHMGAFDVRLDDGTTLTKVSDRDVFLRPDACRRVLRENIAHVDEDVREAASAVTAQARSGWDQSRLQALEAARTGTSRSLDEAKLGAWRRADAKVRDKAKQLAQPGASFTAAGLQAFLEELNAILVGGDSWSGYRTPGQAFLLGVLPADMIHDEVAHFCEWLLASLNNTDPIVLAGQAYAHFNTIHPFHDGNGRTCQMIMDLVLQAGGLPPACLDGKYIIPCDFTNRDSVSAGKAVARVAAAVTTSLETLRSADAAAGASTSSSSSTSTSRPPNMFSQIRELGQSRLRKTEPKQPPGDGKDDDN